MIRRKKNKWIELACTIAAAVVLCGLTSCVDLGQVASFSNMAKQAETALPALTGDLKGTCERFNNYIPPEHEEQKRNCSQYDRLSKGINSAQGVLLNYMQALSQLSADKKVTFSQNTADLATNLKNAGLDETASKSTTGLAGKLFEAITNGYRQKKLASFIRAENADVRILTSALSDIVHKDYKALLSNEKDAMDNYYRRALQQQNLEREPLAAVLVQHQRQQAESDLAARMNAADAYAKIMTSIADGHQKLNDAGNSFNKKDVIQALGKDISDIAGSINDVRTAFK